MIPYYDELNDEEKDAVHVPGSPHPHRRSPRTEGRAPRVSRSPRRGAACRSRPRGGFRRACGGCRTGGGGPRRSRPAGGSGSPSRCGADAFLRRQHPAAAGGRDPGGIRYPQGGAGRWQAPQSPLHGFEVRVGIRHLRGYRRGHRLL